MKKRLTLEEKKVWFKRIRESIEETKKEIEKSKTYPLR